MKILTVVGARPQFIKAASLSRYIANEPGISELILHTGQHYDKNMSDVFFDELDIPAPNFQLNVGASSHGAQTGEMIIGIERVLMENEVDIVLVYGDTNSTLAGALAAKKMHIPVAHVEAGLRSFDFNMPEEINRVVTDSISDIHFCPSESAVKNLANNGVRGEFVVDSGDIMLETLLYYKKESLANRNFIEKHALDCEQYILVTIHRAENTDSESRLRHIIENLCELAKTRRIIFPMHPRTMNKIKEMDSCPPILDVCHVIEPVGLKEMIPLMYYADIVVTDSGGVQKEAFFLGTKVIVARDRTEWTELLNLKAVTLWDPLGKKGLASTIRESKEYNIDTDHPYGDGHVSEIICKELIRYISNG